jgi:anaerobic magnesium-protoporphyrin IX monomethyl ester cyclase
MVAQAPCKVMLVGYHDQGNLGMGYLAAVLKQHGHAVELVDVRDGPEEILNRVVAARPLVVGFSLIFQFFLPQFRAVAQRLRAGHIDAHITIGGHYPSLCHDEVLAQMPELDSVTRYEGEATLLELVEVLAGGGDWHDVAGLAYVADGEVCETAPRALLQDLDTLPWPHRPYDPQLILGLKTMPLLASRGCARRCSFCSIHTFYRTAPGKVVRVRAAERVVEEMRMLYDERGVRVYLFQDDDFPLWGRAGAKWVDRFAAGLRASGLADKVLWKISCRAEYVEPELFAPLRDVGLFMVYMGIESGVESGLVVLHKQMTVEQNLRAVALLKELGIAFSYGFMLFDPSSTFESVRHNVGFLRQIVGDGSAAALFCRMLPYGGTPIRDQLEMEGRLRGDVTHPDYDFLDLRLNRYHALLDQAVAHWVHNDGVSHQINWAWDELKTVERLVPGLVEVPGYTQALTELTANSNELLFDLVETSSWAYESGDGRGPDPIAARNEASRIRNELLVLRNAFVRKNATTLLEAINEADIRGPIMAPQIH